MTYRPHPAAQAAAAAQADDALSPTLRHLRDAIFATPDLTLAEALADARDLLADHARELADIAHSEGNCLYDDSGQRHAQGAWAVRDRLRRYADDLDAADGGA